MADINKEASWVTARLLEVGNATNDGANVLITDANIQYYNAGGLANALGINKGGTGATDAAGARTNLGVPSTGDVTSAINTAVAPKADKVTGATSGNFAGLDANGDLTDSGSKASDFMPALASGTTGNIPMIDADDALEDSGVALSEVITESDLPNVVVGNAEQLASNNFKTDSIPYLYRQTGGGVEAGTREYDSIVGGSVVHNQMLNGRTTAITINGITLTPNGDGSFTATGTATANATINLDVTIMSFAVNHVYYFQTAHGTISTYYCSVSGTTGGGIYGSSLLVPSILKATIARGEHYRLFVYSGQTVNFTFTPLIIDLTSEFGTAVADKILELYGGANTGKAEPFMATLGMTRYTPYTAEPSLLSAMPTAHKTVGFNQFDKSTTQVGYIGDTTGDLIANANYRCTDYIRVLPDTSYYVRSDQAATKWGAWYDTNKVFIRGITAYNQPVTSPSNAKYIRLTMVNFNVNTGNVDTFCVNISDPTRNGQYEPYTEHTYPLDSSLTLRGVAVTDADGNIKFDGDEYAPDGTVTRRYGIVDLGELNWNKTNGSSIFLSSTISDILAGTQNGIPHIICDKFITDTDGNVWSKVTDNTITVGYTRQQLYVNAQAYISGTAAQFKTAMSGVYLIYERTSSGYVTETAEPYDAVQICDPLGTEEYVITGIVPVGHETRYPENQVAKLDGLPSDFSTLIAPTEKAYKATRPYTVGRLLIVNNILYRVSSAISSGATLTVGTNISETTLDEVIASL